MTLDTALSYLVQVIFALGLPLALALIILLLREATHSLLSVTKLDTITNEYATMTVNITALAIVAVLPLFVCIHKFDGFPLVLALFMCINLVLFSINFAFDKDFIKSKK